MSLWNRFWFARAEILPLSVTRIGIGAIWLTHLAVTAPNWNRFYGHDGILSLGETELHAQRAFNPLDLIALTDGRLDISVWWWIGFILSLGVMIGFQTRAATVGLYLFACALIQRNNFIVNGEELVTRMLLFYGCFSPWGKRLSIDAWLATHRHHQNPSEPVFPYVWSWRLMQINFLLIYLISVPYKFAQDLDWLTGDALHWTVSSDLWWTRGWMSQLTLSFDGALRKALTWGTILVEIGFPICVCFRTTRLAATLCVMGLHLGIALCIPGVTLFTLSMVVGAAMFLPIPFDRKSILFRYFLDRRFSLMNRIFSPKQQSGIVESMPG